LHQVGLTNHFTLRMHGHTNIKREFMEGGTMNVEHAMFVTVSEEK